LNSEQDENDDGRRTDTASRVIWASAAAIYDALLDPAKLVKWLPPAGMSGQIYRFEPREGGRFRMALTHREPQPLTRGKTSEDTDAFEGCFLELIPNARVVQAIKFESDDPAFSGELRMTWSFTPVAGGTEVAIVCQNVPAEIRKEDHDAGMRSTLANLARLLEQ
jgi:uncharacterized protein YndB with AHSA1/START domain